MKEDCFLDELRLFVVFNHLNTRNWMERYLSQNFRNTSGTSSDKPFTTSTEALSTVIDDSCTVDTEVVIIGEYLPLNLIEFDCLQIFENHE